MRTRRDWAYIAAAIAFLSVAALALVGRASAPPLSPGTRECIGFPAEKCDEWVAALEQQAATYGGLSAYRLVCTSGSCTSQEGKGIRTVVFADGKVQDSGFGYAVPGEPPSSPGHTEPPLTVTPTCINVQQFWCGEFARSALSQGASEGEAVASITVECSATCTETNGDARVLITLTGGRTLVADGYSYRGP
jgi:hypothetical protein